MTTITIEPETPTTKTKGRVLRQAWFYGPTYLLPPKHDPDAELSLFVRRFREISMPSGRVELRVMRNVEGFSTEEEMVAAIEARQMREWDAIDANPPLDTLPDDGPFSPAEGLVR